MNIKGVGLIAFYDNETANWVSKMKVMGVLKNETVNFLSVTYSKAGEMIDTLKNSGAIECTPLLGEYGFLGGIIKQIDTYYILTVFSGASGEEVTVIAKVGLETYLENTLQ